MYLSDKKKTWHCCSKNLMKFDDIEAGRIHGHVIKSDRRGGEQEIRRPILDPLPPS